MYKITLLWNAIVNGSNLILEVHCVFSQQLHWNLTCWRWNWPSGGRSSCRTGGGWGGGLGSSCTVGRWGSGLNGATDDPNIPPVSTVVYAPAVVPTVGQPRFLPCTLYVVQPNRRPGRSVPEVEADRATSLSQLPTHHPTDEQSIWFYSSLKPSNQ